MKTRFLLIACSLFLIGKCAFAQSIQDLRTEKERTAKEIALTKELLRQAEKNAKSSSNKLFILNKNIMLRTKLIDMMNKEIEVLDGFIDDNRCFIIGLRKDLEKLRQDYARTIQFAQKNRKSQDKFLFLLSAKDFNQAYKRLIYMRQYANYREKQADHIKAVFHLINVQLRDLASRRLQKDKLMRGKENERKELNNEKRIQSEYLRGVKHEQQGLRSKLREKMRVQQQLQREIERLIAEEARKSREKGGSGQFSLSPEQKVISGNFEKNRGRLPWPIERGVISDYFGEHEHPLMKGVMVRNNGLDFSTSRGARARAVFEGEVSRIVAIPGGNMAVIIRHGRYLTVYSNLRDVSVRVGQKVRIKEDLGTIYTDPADDNRTILKFQIWKESSKLDPGSWVTR
ncbi:MAG: peptidoglycan DD-metalloendopeptidase family protein [Bacteroidota bacterium]|nr:peptidoglycan DD-metalloendopeptidase family protein [Bacteroidota bacterium]MDP4204573.1 peptidoglycan DD-metalloendopeptidase family protein [Bacteroidota bacterium]